MIAESGHHNCTYCHAEYDLAQHTGVQLLDVHGRRVEPPGTEAERFRQAELRVRPFCLNSTPHPLPQHDALLVGVYGPVRGGKNALLNTMRVAAGTAGLLSRFGIGVAAATEDQAAWSVVAEMRATPQATREAPHAPLTLKVDEGRIQRSVIMFNTSGEEFQPERWIHRDATADLRVGCPFTPELDVIVVVVPPPALVPGLADDDSKQSLEAVVAGIQSITQFIGSDGLPARVRNHQRSVILALTKCDKYHGIPDFPQHLLRSRGDLPIRQAMAEEQPLLADFMDGNGGRGIMDAASRIATPVFLTAISGTGADQPGDAPSQHSDSTRSLDPLLVAMMRRGWGRYD